MEGAGFGNTAQAANALGRGYVTATTGYAQEVATPPQTLASALSMYDGLHNRLNELTKSAHQLAAMVGGPFPIGAPDQPKTATPQPDFAVRRLNETANDCHRQVDQLQECLNAMARSLGV